MENIRTLTQKSIDQLLIIIRSEGFTSLPKSYKTLLGTSSLSGDSKIMRSADDTLGKFNYFGIKTNLNVIIDLYKERTIKLIIHVDGMDIFNNSKKGFWSIMGKIFSNIHLTKLFLIALYYGNSKHYSAREFLQELVEEANSLTKEGTHII